MEAKAPASGFPIPDLEVSKFLLCIPSQLKEQLVSKPTEVTMDAGVEGQSA